MEYIKNISSEDINKILDISKNIIILLTTIFSAIKFPKNLGSKGVYYYSHEKLLNYDMKLINLVFEQLLIICIVSACFMYGNSLGIAYIFKYVNFWKANYLYCILIYISITIIVYILIFSRYLYKFKVLCFNKNIFSTKTYKIDWVYKELIFGTVIYEVIYVIECILITCGLVRSINIKILYCLTEIYIWSHTIFIGINFVLWVGYGIKKLVLKVHQNDRVNYLPGMHITIKFDDTYFRYNLDESEITLHDDAVIHLFHAKEGPLIFKNVKEVYIAKQKFIYENDIWMKVDNTY